MIKKILSIVAILVSSICYAEEANDNKSLKKFAAEQIERIDHLSQAIDKTNSLDDLSTLELYNERGISYFFIGEFENALIDFNHVIAKSESQPTLDIKLIGTALWGRLFCHAFSNQLQETYDDSLLIQFLFMDHVCCEERMELEKFIKTSNHNNAFFIIPVAKFATPEEKITKRECHDRTSSIADKMRSLADLIPLFVVRNIVLFTIDKLSNNAHECCERGNHWTVCLGPIADAWKKLDNTWDQLVDLFKRGIKIEAFITGSGNL